MSGCFLDIILISGSFISDSRSLIKQSPVVRFQCGDQRCESTVKHRVGLEASWNERFSMSVSKDHQSIKLQVFSSNVLTDEFIGETETISIKQGELHEKLEYQIFNKDKKSAGILTFKLGLRGQFDSSSGESEEGQSSQSVSESRTSSYEEESETSGSARSKGQ